MTIDLDKPIPKKDETLQELLERLNRSVDKLVEIQTPGVHGIEGTEPVPECTIDTFNVAPNHRFMIGGNRRRKSLYVTVSRVQTGGTDLADAYINITTRDGWDKLGAVIGIDDEFRLFDSTNSIYLEAVADDGSVAPSPVTVTVVQENS